LDGDKTVVSDQWSGRRAASLAGKAEATTCVRLVQAQVEPGLPRFQKMFVELRTRTP